MSLPWQLQEIDGQLLCLVGLGSLIRFLSWILFLFYLFIGSLAIFFKFGVGYIYALYNLQVVELDFLYPSEGIHRRWDAGYRITSTAATWDQAALVLSVPRRKPADETQETLRTSAFPSTHVKVVYLINYAFLDTFHSFCHSLVFWPPGYRVNH